MDPGWTPRRTSARPIPWWPSRTPPRPRSSSPPRRGSTWSTPRRSPLVFAESGDVTVRAGSESRDVSAADIAARADTDEDRESVPPPRRWRADPGDTHDVRPRDPAAPDATAPAPPPRADCGARADRRPVAPQPPRVNRGHCAPRRRARSLPAWLRPLRRLRPRARRGAVTTPRGRAHGCPRRGRWRRTCPCSRRTSRRRCAPSRATIRSRSVRPSTPCARTASRRCPRRRRSRCPRHLARCCARARFLVHRGERCGDRGKLAEPARRADPRGHLPSAERGGARAPREVARLLIAPPHRP